MRSGLGEIIVRTLVWIAFVTLWATQRVPSAGVLAVRHGFPLLIGGLLITSGALLYGVSAWTLAAAPKNAMGSPTALMVSGPYRYVRNPLYLAIAVILVGISTAYGAWTSQDLVGLAAVALIAHLAVVALEEPATRRRLGPAYDAYCRKVPRWIPRRRSSV